MFLASLLATLPIAVAPQRAQDGAATRDNRASTQAESEPDRRRVSAADLDLLHGRDRSRINPKEDPLEIVGIDASDADFRARTPALARAHVQPLAVDMEELRRRQVAMLEGGRSFSAPPRMYVPMGADAGVDEVEPPDEDDVVDEEPNDSGAPWMWLGVVAGAAAAVALVRRLR